MKKFFIRNVTKQEVPLLDKAPELAAKGLLGWVDVVFDENGREYLGVFTPVRGVDWSKCKTELTDFVHYLRYSTSCPAFSSRKGMTDYIALACNSPAFKPIKGSDDVCISGSEEYQYFVRLSPDGESDAVVFCYEKKKLIELGITVEVPNKETRKATVEVNKMLKTGNGKQYDSFEKMYEDIEELNMVD